MRHRKHSGQLNLATAPRKALIRNQVEALLTHEKVRTTQPRAAAVRRQAEKMITLGKDGGQAARRRAFAFLQSKVIVHKLFEEIGPRFAERNGGYLRIVKEGPRYGDGAMMAIVEMVDREIQLVDADAEKKKARARRLRDLRRQVGR